MTSVADNRPEAQPSNSAAVVSLARSLTSALVTPKMFSALARGLESVALSALGICIVELSTLPGSRATLLAPLASVLLATSIMSTLGVYSTAALSAPQRNSGRVMLAWTIAIAVLAATTTILKFDADLSRPYLLTWFFVGLVGLVITRGLLALATHVARNAGYLTRNAIVYGSGGSSEDLIDQLRADANSDVRICAVFDDRGDARAPASIADVPCLGNIDDLKKFTRSGRVDMLIMSMPLSAEARVNMLMERFAELPIDVRLAATASKLRFHKSAYTYIGSVPVIDLSQRPISGWNACLKWAFDKIIATMAVVFLTPVMVVVAALVKYESKGPVIFRQKRYGFNNELIEVFKFRSMYTDRADASASRLVTKDDPRVTCVGRIIRKTSLDELPQLFNVLGGTLSLVGPRPHAVQAKAADRLYPDVVDGYFARHKVKPGITGWAQINGWRGETDTAEKIRKRVEFDLAYIENWSLWSDVCILVKTPVALLKTENAY